MLPLVMCWALWTIIMVLPWWYGEMAQEPVARTFALVVACGWALVLLIVGGSAAFGTYHYWVREPKRRYRNRV